MITPVFLYDYFIPDDISSIFDTDAEIQNFKYVLIVYSLIEEIYVGNTEMDQLISR